MIQKLWGAVAVACLGCAAEKSPPAPPAPAAESAAEKPAAPAFVQIRDWSGTGSRTLERFASENGEIVVSCGAGPIDPAAPAYVHVAAYGPGGEQYLVISQPIRRNKQIEHGHIHGPPGAYYLEVSAVNVGWVVIVQDLQADPGRRVCRSPAGGYDLAAGPAWDSVFGLSDVPRGGWLPRPLWAGTHFSPRPRSSPPGSRVFLC